MDKSDKRSLTSPINGQNGGVKTPEGKAISSQNAVKHGIMAKYGTRLDDISFEEAYKMFADEFGDDTPFRQTLITQLAVLYIRIRRCSRFENEYLREKLNPPKFEKKKVRDGMDLDMSIFDAQYETVTVEAGEPMTFDPQNLSGLENVYTKYEPQFLSRFCHIVDILTRSDK